MNPIRKIITNQCPNCDKGHIYSNKNIYFNFSTNKMHKECSNCGFKFEKEPGFFFGAMYVSYALSIAEIVSVFIISRLFFESIFDIRIILYVVITLILLSSFNMRIARIIWIYLMRNT